MNTGIVTNIIVRLAATTMNLCRSDHQTTGVYMRIRRRLTGCVRSLWIRPTRAALVARHSHTGRKWKLRKCMNISRSAGSSVMARKAATMMERFLVYARGRNRRPSSACNVSTGRNATPITSRA